tara:strand:- start:85 stop:579 length:495 start_codon:yes stop_codon:yes gene_type:complete
MDNIKTAKDYYNDDGVREIAKGIKKKNNVAIILAAKEMAKNVPENSILIPIPNSCGYADYTLELAKRIAEFSGGRVEDVIGCKKRESLYKLKIDGQKINPGDLGFFKKSCVSDLKNKKVFLVDNVIGTGMTMRCAKVIVPNGEPLVYAQDKGLCKNKRNKKSLT